MSKWSGEFSSDAVDEVYNFVRCQRVDGSHYGTGGQCRKGVEVSPAEKAEKIREALAMPFAEFEKTYGKQRDANMAAAAAEQARVVTETAKITDLSVADARKLLTAKRLSGTLTDIDEIRALGPEGVKMANKMASTKQFFDDMKWRLTNDRLLITQDTLDTAWEGKDLTAPAKVTFGSKEYGQSRTVVWEHPVPSKTLKSELVASKDRTPRGVAETVISRNFISFTSAREDNKLNAEFKSSMPNPKVPMSRYQRAEVKTFMLNDKISTKDVELTAATVRIGSTVKKAKADGLTKEEWIASIVEL